MTVIHGDITKIYEIEKDAYTQPVTGGRIITPYTYAANIAGTSTGYFELNQANFGNVVLLHSIHVSSSSVALQRIYLVHYDGTILLDANFRYDSQKQFYLGDIRIDLTIPGSYFRVYLENNAVGIQWIGGTIFYKPV